MNYKKDEDKVVRKTFTFPKSLWDKFDKLCEKKRYKKSTLIQVLIKEFMKSLK